MNTGGISEIIQCLLHFSVWIGFVLAFFALSSAASFLMDWRKRRAQEREAKPREILYVIPIADPSEPKANGERKGPGADPGPEEGNPKRERLQTWQL